MSDTLLTIDGLTKAYPGVVANSDVSFDIMPGEIHALLGENGAGKSTLVKMIYGLVKPDSGQMHLHGNPFAPPEPRAARSAGVAMVFQHFSLFDALSVAENVALGMENPPGLRQLARKIREISTQYGLPLDPARRVADLSAGERQRVEIVRCLLQDPKLLIMDEPTSVLTPQEVEILFRTLRQLSAEGTAILYISHKLEEIRSICKRATILRGGKIVGSCRPRDKSARELAEMMVGAELKLTDRAERRLGDVVLSVTGLDLAPLSQFGPSLKDVSLNLHKGEVLGIGGVAGNGQEELLATLSGERPSASGTVTFNGRDISTLAPNARRRLGVLTAPEERLGHAAVPAMSLTDNTLLTGCVRQPLAPHGFVDTRATKAFAEKIIGAFDVRTPGPQVAAQALSGGNLQKFVIGREVLQQPDVLVVNQPTWGVDAAAAAAIRQSLLDVAARGGAVIVISQDLDELMEISDHFAALNEGRLSVPHKTDGLSIEDIGLMLGGAHGMTPADAPHGTHAAHDGGPA
ncbi:ABC transporter ATP-binding protein [Rhodobacteraceae bacterium]|nr:ABC transporter ATP-binding protein [Paracoccaceae bacterium]